MRVTRSALVPYSAAQMYAVVADIKAYPDFLPWCSASAIHSTEGDRVVAAISVEYAKLAFDFATENINQPNAAIEIDLVSGPFTELRGRWDFHDLSEEGCKVALEMQFEFKRSIARHLLARVFSNIVSKQIDAFHRRANDVYQ